MVIQPGVHNSTAVAFVMLLFVQTVPYTAKKQSTKDDTSAAVRRHH